MKQKEQVGANIYVDDTPQNITNLRDRGVFAICYANSTNKAIAAPRANNWDEVYDLVHEQAKKLGFPK